MGIIFKEIPMAKLLSRDFFKNNREKLFKLMEKRSIALVFANQVMTTSNLPIKFQQDANFFYLTGIKKPNMILYLYKGEKKKSAFLFLERNIPELEVWLGKKIGKGEARKISGITCINYVDRFPAILNSNVASVENIYFSFEKHPVDEPLTKPMQIKRDIQEHYPFLKFLNLDSLTDKLRVKKEKVEIECIRRAIEYTKAGIMKIMQSAKPKMMEYELEAMFHYEVVKRGEKQLPFLPIVAKGINASVLHYADNSHQIDQGQLVQLDVGASFSGYSADISRVLPISGKFNDRQRQVYEEVLKVQKEMIQKVKPGISIKELHKESIQLLTESMKKLGLIKRDKQFKKYYMHTIGHFLGLQTHDVGDRHASLEPGNVLTIEPGIYIKEEEIGVRIEDDILVTENGAENLSKDIPKEIDEIEEIRRKGDTEEHG